jgi:hypothetical protein
MVNSLRFAAHGGEPVPGGAARVHPVTALLAAPIARLMVWKDRRTLAREVGR